MNMNATISLEGLWAIVDSLSTKNKKWLADKLLSSLSSPTVSQETEILDGIARSVNEAKTGKTLPLDSLWDQL